MLGTTTKAFADYTLLQPIGDLNTIGEYGEYNPTTLSSYVQQIIKIGIVLAGLLAVVKIVIAGIMYVTAAGNTGTIERAKGSIWDAIIGVIIAVSFYILLAAINPDILKTDGLIPALKKNPTTGESTNLLNPEQWTEGIPKEPTILWGCPPGDTCQCQPGWEFISMTYCSGEVIMCDPCTGCCKLVIPAGD